MERAEVIDILTRMKALPEDVESLDPNAVTFDAYRLLEDPIITNRIAVEALQQLPRNYKFDVVLAANEESKLLAYAIATAAGRALLMRILKVGKALRTVFISIRMKRCSWSIRSWMRQPRSKTWSI